MEIRSVTLFVDPAEPPLNLPAFLAAARERFPYRMQSLRLATPPFPDWLDGDDPAKAAVAFAESWHEQGIDYISLGPVLPNHGDRWIETLPEILAVTDTVFATAITAGLDGRIHTGRCRQMAAVIRQISTLLPDGFKNLFSGALAFCGPGHPFLPASYHDGGPARFAIALEAADLVQKAIETSDTLEAARTRLVAVIESTAAALQAVADRLAADFNIEFGGIDFSPAPYPSPEKSLAAALEALGVPGLAAPGGLFAAAFITEAIDRANFRRTGFSGLMLPVLEDTTLARRAAEGSLGLDDLLLYSAVCGVGLDTVPLPGDISEETLAGILLDTAALATRLRKPLVARLMPLPGLQAGDEAIFDFEYFARSRVMAVPDRGIGRLLAKSATLDFKPIRQRPGS